MRAKLKTMTAIRARSRRPIRSGGRLSACVVLGFRADLERDAVEQLAGFVGGQHGRLALLDDVLGAADGGGRVGVDDMAGHQPVEQHRMAARCCLTVGSAGGAGAIRYRRRRGWARCP